MRRASRVLSQWIELVAELERRPCAGFPYQPLLAQFVETFDAGAGYTWRTADGEPGFHVHGQPDHYTPQDYVDTWIRGTRRVHPLIRWFGVTGDPAAMSLARVPAVITPPGDQADLRDWLLPFGIDRQLSIPCNLQGRAYRTFVLAKTGPDFSDEDVEVARAVQPLLLLLDRHVDAVGQLDPGCDTQGLSGREIAVLRLLADGGTASSVATRLGISPRTVNKHLERIYRKLQVRDRVTAVREAEKRGLVPVAVGVRR